MGINRQSPVECRISGVTPRVRGARAPRGAAHGPHEGNHVAYPAEPRRGLLEAVLPQGHREDQRQGDRRHGRLQPRHVLRVLHGRLRRPRAPGALAAAGVVRRPAPRSTGDDDRRPHERFVKLYERNRDYFVVLLGEHGDPGFQQRIKRHMRPILRSVLAAEGPADDLETEVTVEFVLAAMIGVLGWWFARPHASSTARLVALVQDLMEKGALHRWRN